ncbi:MAG: cell division protein ZapA [bacterium]|nr:cell division protein ZapA [bacterium]
MSTEPIVVRVKIFGQEYGIKAEADADYIRKVAEYLDAKMRDVEETLPAGSTPMKIAVLAALNLTDELFMAWEERDRMRQELEDRAKQLSEKMARELGEF